LPREPGGDDRWASEAFLRDACDAMVSEIDWDTIDSGRLHQASCAARTLDGRSVIAAVLDHEAALPSVLEDAQDERREAGQTSAPLWLYAPVDLELRALNDEQVVVRRVGRRRR
jgi:hypothetical protein